MVEPSWTSYHVAYRIGTRHALDRGRGRRAILAARRGQDGYVATDGELQSGAHGIAAPLVGVAGLEASLGVVTMVELDASSRRPAGAAAARRGRLAPALRPPPRSGRRLHQRQGPVADLGGEGDHGRGPHDVPVVDDPVDDPLQVGVVAGDDADPHVARSR